MRIHVLLLVLIVEAASVAAAEAQTAAPRDWEPVVFISRVGAPDEIRARLIALDDTSLTIRLDGRELALPLAEVTRIQKQGDGLLNGALIGGIGLGVWCALVCGQGLNDAGSLPLVAVLNGAVGALIGTGIDALHKGRTTIYRRTPGAGGLVRPGAAITFSVRF